MLFVVRCALLVVWYCLMSFGCCFGLNSCLLFVALLCVVVGWLVVVRCLLLVIGSWFVVELLVVGGWLSVVGCWFFEGCKVLVVVCCSLFVVGNWFLVRG